MGINPYQLTFDGHDGAGNPFLCTQHFTFEDGSYDSTYNAAKDLADSWWTNVTVQLLDCFGTDVRVFNVAAQGVSPIGGFKYVKNHNSAGTGGGLSTVSGLSMNIELRVGSAPYKAGHMYLPGCEQGSVVDSTWIPAYLTTVETFAAIAFTTMTLSDSGVSATPVVYRRRRITPAPVAASWKTIVGHALQTKPTLMGRRLLPQL